MPSKVRPVCGHCLRSAPGTALLLLAFYAAVEAEKPDGWTKLKYKLCLLDLASAKLDQKLLMATLVLGQRRLNSATSVEPAAFKPAPLKKLIEPSLDEPAVLPFRLPTAADPLFAAPASMRGDPAEI